MHSRELALKFAALTLIIAAVVYVPLAHARLVRNTIDETATVIDDGQSVVLTGPIECSQEQWVDMRVTVTQRSTGAVAEGHALILGTKTEQQWEIVADLQGDATFKKGEATAVALATSMKKNGQVDDAHQWLVNMTLVQE